GRWVEQREVEANLLHATVEQLGQHHRDAVQPERIPEENPRGKKAPTGGERRAAEPDEPRSHSVAGYLAHAINHHWHELDQMAIGVDDRMGETATDPQNLVTRSEVERHA